MAENNDAIFSLDVGDVLARLHISSILKLNNQPYFRNRSVVAVFNTGIVDMVDNPGLDSVKNNGVSFDMTAHDQTYEVGVLFHKFRAANETYYARNFNRKKSDARIVIRDYFAAFAGLFKAKDVERSELHGFLVEKGVLPWNVDTYNQYGYKLPISKEIPSEFRGPVDWEDQLCFKVQYKLNSDTM